MKGNVLIFAPLYLLVCWELPVDSMRIHFNFTLQDAKLEIPLDMVDHSVDDMYFGCNQKMMEKIKSSYFLEEYMGPFADVWKKAKYCAKDKLKQKEDMALTKDHLQAICVYTSDYELFYRTFNDAVRTRGSSYGSSFQFHSLHFLLTSAIQILNNNYVCHTTYRRTNIRFTGQINQRMRFGFFASSSYKPNLTDFGKETCFKIETCSGAFLKHYSYFGESEAEVLIPPYEVFNITHRIEGEDEVYRSVGVKSCKLMYILKSAGCKSTQNCKAALM
ncbi:erythroblast NAD(P)(+)--arginine ADP-ribosyltransferase-like [Trachinotus anak]|uniref:erythroblast NAD(P)(+)--arginine ADP-ribosyltransferase-like n=1 Tax=Trachinotus anak TaxID=443729 RepID=UPI0039F1DED5